MATNIHRFAMKPKEEGKTGIRSRVMFAGNFKEELELTIDAVADMVEQEIPKHFQLHSISFGSNNLKVRICDDVHVIDRTVNCMFKYKNDDVRYGNISVEFSVTETSKKTQTRNLGKFCVSDRGSMSVKILKEMLSCIEAIY